MAASKMDETAQGNHHSGPYSISQSTNMQLLQHNGMTWGL
jgi:hypothetical protein